MEGWEEGKERKARKGGRQIRGPSAIIEDQGTWQKMGGVPSPSQTGVSQYSPPLGPAQAETDQASTRLSLPIASTPE